MAEPIRALLAACDVSAMAGEVVMIRGVDNITLPAAASMYDGGRYPDLSSWLHGYGSQAGRDLTAELRAAWVLAGGAAIDWEVDIADTDRVRVRLPSASLAAWSVVASGGNGWGYATGTTPAVVSGSYRQVVAPSAWTRGPLDLAIAPHLLVVTDGILAASIGTQLARSPSIPTAMRSSLTTDGGVGPTTALEDADNDAADNALRRIRWGIDSTGRVWTSYPSPGVSHPGWLSTAAGLAFRRVLGFTGAETPAVANNQAVVTATHRTPLVAVLPYGLASYDYGVRTISRSVAVLGGLPVGRTFGATHEHRLRMSMRGPTHAVSDLGHIQRHLLPRLGAGAQATIALDIGDPRRHVTIEGVQDGTAVDVETTATTGEHLRGRIVGRVSEDGGRYDLAMSDARVFSGPIDLTIVEA